MDQTIGTGVSASSNISLQLVAEGIKPLIKKYFFLYPSTEKAIENSMAFSCLSLYWISTFYNLFFETVSAVCVVLRVLPPVRQMIERVNGYA
ncbi:hypothetical protein [Clostridium sp. KNHs216]|uniref:hypothetical protein n=1 Tax=Clostridium sp. KNHs216 TaxID=1550235 RepID=UPI00114DE22A|nr:hypothetical protein [Clostridium sp. KNHs216]